MKKKNLKNVHQALATMSWCRGDVKSDAVVLSMRRLWLSMNGHKQSCRTLHRCQHFPQQPQPIGGDHDMRGTVIFLRCRLHGKQIEFLDDNQRKLYRTARRSRIWLNVGYMANRSNIWTITSANYTERRGEAESGLKLEISILVEFCYSGWLVLHGILPRGVSTSPNSKKNKK